MVDGAFALKALAFVFDRWAQLRTLADRHPIVVTVASWFGAVVATVYALDVGAQLKGGVALLAGLPAPLLAAAATVGILWRREKVLRLGSDAPRLVFIGVTSLGLCCLGWYTYVSGPWLPSALLGILVVSLGLALGTGFRRRRPVAYPLLALLAVALAAAAVLVVPRSTRITPLRFCCPRTTELVRLDRSGSDVRYLNHECSGVLDLTDAKLDHADLSHANLAGAKLTRADLTGARLEDADLSRANLGRACFARAHMSRAALVDVQGERACLCGATLVGASLGSAVQAPAEFPSLDLSYTDLSQATAWDLRSVDLTRVTAHGASFRGSLYASDLSGGDFSRAAFAEATLSADRTEPRLVAKARGDDATRLPSGLSVLCNCTRSGPPGGSGIPRVVPGQANCAAQECGARPIAEGPCARRSCVASGLHPNATGRAAD